MRFTIETEPYDDDRKGPEGPFFMGEEGGSCEKLDETTPD